jgi:hypothetical protein
MSTCYHRKYTDTELHNEPLLPQKLDRKGFKTMSTCYHRKYTEKGFKQWALVTAEIRQERV